MHSIKIHKLIAVIIAFLHRYDFWHQGDKPATARQLKTKSFYCIYYFMSVIATSMGAIKNEKVEQTIFLTEVSIGVAVDVVKLWILIWKQNEIQGLLKRICEFEVRNDEDYNAYNDKLGRFVKFLIVFLIAVFVCSFIQSVFIPAFGSEKILFFEIAFPLDYRNNEVAFWMATVFLFTETVLTIIAVFFSILIWYLLLNCSLRYEVLASEMRNMGKIMDSKKGQNVIVTSIQKSFVDDLKASINVHLHLTELTNELGSFCSDIFFIQFGTSGLCICGSIYSLAFDIGDNVWERCVYLLLFIYVVAELFMITYFGNEIMRSSNGLSYSLFESDWYNQPQATRKCVIIFGEYLKTPQVLLIGKLYQLTLETFTKIFNSAYSMFNILKNFKN
ncbi:odorant receptor 94a-like [Bradysia coprophila]|uniref:odorant receptor 94a-like n=1 Tax=Bradysia coprophila TaxID=38358 RepID=UPI00187DA8BD|nr:odorant receptor 94a-like [Bradysia coprophila]